MPSISETFSEAAVIGAGPSGLASLKELRRLGVDVLCFEAAAGIAPRWRQDGHGRPTPVYDSLRLNNSFTRMRFAERSIDLREGDYPTARQFHSYLREIATSLGLIDRIRLAHDVREIERRRAAWALTFTDRPPHLCRHLIIATGLNGTPTIPASPRFGGVVTHTCAYRNPSRLASLRVLVVGAGNSGAEIASELVGVAATVDLAVAHPFHVVPRHVMGFPGDRLDGPLLSRLPLTLRQLIHDIALWPVRHRARRAGLSDPSMPLLRSAWTISSDLIKHVAAGRITMRGWPRSCVGSQVTFADGSTGEFDHIVLATGYKPSLPHLPEMPPITRNENRCFLKIVPHESVGLPDTYFAGFVLPLGALLPVVQAQARWIAGVIVGRMAKLSPVEMERVARKDFVDSAARFSGSHAHSMLVDPYPYIRRLSRQP